MLKMIFNNKTLVATSLVFTSFASLAEYGEKVCSNVVSYKDIYGGLAQCDAPYTTQTCEPKPNGYDIITENKKEPLSQQVGETTGQYKTLWGQVSWYYSEGAGPNACTLPVKKYETVHCTAELDFIRKEQVVTTECDYKPVSSISTSPHEFWYTHVGVSGKDYDGHIVNTELWINGVKQSSSYRVYESSSPFTVRVKVTDNDGYTHETTKTVTPVYQGPIMCGSRPC